MRNVMKTVVVCLFVIGAVVWGLYSERPRQVWP